ncbi:hypothetical protein B0H17DRAFT_1283724 [Mycena rosella]|uniref:Uncharacterized protein n=1 Tax=Mycena rosella TaxID=1033263 RepID=A0AAD7DID3_MYCRO|nr:hypothetical protein B0H17DRAFT_1283724 [Mycena rosella]
MCMFAGVAFPSPHHLRLLPLCIPAPHPSFSMVRTLQHRHEHKIHVPPPLRLGPHAGLELGSRVTVSSHTPGAPSSASLTTSPLRGSAPSPSPATNPSIQQHLPFTAAWPSQGLLHSRGSSAHRCCNPRRCSSASAQPTTSPRLSHLKSQGLKTHLTGSSIYSALFKSLQCRTLLVPQISKLWRLLKPGFNTALNSLKSLHRKCEPSQLPIKSIKLPLPDTATTPLAESASNFPHRTDNVQHGKNKSLEGLTLSYFENVQAIFDKHLPQNIFKTSFTNGGVFATNLECAECIARLRKEICKDDSGFLPAWFRAQEYGVQSGKPDRVPRTPRSMRRAQQRKRESGYNSMDRQMRHLVQSHASLPNSIPWGPVADSEDSIV